MTSRAERLAVSEGFASDLLAAWDASGREDVPSATVEELARMWGFLVDVPAGKHLDCNACAEGILACTELRLPMDNTVPYGSRAFLEAIAPTGGRWR